MQSLSCIHHGDTSVYYLPDVCEQLSLPKPETHWFDSSTLPIDFEITGQAEGRGTTWFIEYQGIGLVLRKYRRGGLIAKLSVDQFLYLSASLTRPVKELMLLAQMQRWHLPAPTPIAGLIKRQGLTWQGDLITQRIDGATDVHNLLQARELSPMEWRHIGATIKRFHHHQVFHHDLNIHNIMLDTEGQAWLIDFDKCKIRRGQGWKKQNLARLMRSLTKEQNKHAHYHFKSQDWQALLGGYNSHTQ